MVFNNTCECMQNLCKKYTWTRIYTYTYTYITVHIHTQSCIHITHIYICVHIYTHIYMDTYTYTYAYTYTYIYMYMYMYMYMHIYIYLSISIAFAHPVASVKQMCTLNALRSARSNELYVHIFLTCAGRRDSGETSVRATSVMYMCWSLVSSIRPSGRWPDVVSSNGLRSSSSFRFGDRVMWLLILTVFTLAECVKKVRTRTFRSNWACRVIGLMCCT